MISLGFEILAAIVTVAILWGSATWFRKKFNRSDAEQALINFVGVILLIVSIMIFVRFGKELVYLFQ